jgi:iron complex outermembrane receptor protein
LWGTAFAQTTPPDSASEPSALEEVVVTGTSIRGAAPVGANLIAVGPADLAAAGAQSVQQALVNVPALTGMGNVGQGQTNNSYYQPSIHSLGASASNSTLILIDGHRPPTGGTNHSTADPNIIPINMIERIEVLADGASSVYGSDAVSGVVNFITRKRFDGLQLSGQTSFVDGATDHSASVLAGKSWDEGATMFAYSHMGAGGVNNSDRPYTNPNHIAQGGTNFNNFNCDSATLQPGGTGNIFLDAVSGSSLANTAANSPCNAWSSGALVLREVRDNFMVKAGQNFGDAFNVNGEVVYGRRRNEGLISAGTVTATAFQGGSQANPFYATPAGYGGTATNETIRWDADSLLGPGRTLNGADTMYADITAQYQIGDNFVIDLLALAGRDDSYTFTRGVVNGSVATLALNGTTSSAGSLTAVSVPGTNVIVTGLPLTAANALDVWNPASTNRTSAAVRAALTDNANMLRLVNGIQQYRLSTNGSLFDLPAGRVSVAVGAEMYLTKLEEDVERANNSGPASNGSQQLHYNFDRTVRSYFAELNVPLVGAGMDVPLVRKLEVNISGRYDDYSDFGRTRNPKFAFNWDVIDGLRLRGSASTSFVAPLLDILGDENGAFATTGWNSVTNSIQVPVSAYPELTQLGIPGCTAAATTCNISSLQGVQVTSGDHHMKPQKGRGWSFGTDFNPTFLPGLRTQLTLWDTEFTGGVTGPNIQNVINTASMNYLLTFYPGGANANQIAQFTNGIPQRSTVPTVTSYIFRSLNSNFLNLYVRGIDGSFDYTFQTGTLGQFKVGAAVTEFLKYDQSYGAGGAVYDVLNTSGSNTSFPSVKTQARASLGWAGKGFAADLFVNYTGSYRNWSGNSVIPITRNAAGNPSGGGDPVKANTTLDVHLGYVFSSGMLEGDEVSLTGRNIFDKEPPFYNSLVGYDTYVASPLGRLITVGFTARWN